MIEAFVTGDREVMARFDKLGPDLRRELKVGISRLTAKLQGNVKADKLSGQVLGVRTGRGRRSIEEVVTEEGDKIAGIVSTAVPYMIGWETGWDGVSGVKASTKKFNPKGGGSADTFANGSPKKRAFLVPALKELQDSGAILAEVEAAVSRAVK